MNIIKRVFDFKGAPLLAAAFILLIIAERKRPLRKQKLKLSNRLITNSLVAAPSFLLARLLFIPAMVAIARGNDRPSGIFSIVNSNPLQPILAFLLMDLGSYLWHNLNHKLPFLWRFHVVHHSDLDLDLSTAIRFHFGEMIGSVFFRGFFVWLSRATPLNVLVYEIIFEAETQFHHSNFKLDSKLEKLLSFFIVTPNMHGIHHSNELEITNSNYSVIFSFWDRIFDTLNLSRTQESITIGAPFLYNSSDFSVKELLKMPFEKIR